jgi:PiT family inorganic phosphate transporter
MVDPWVILTLVFSFMMAFSIGSNDAANGLGTSYGTKALPLTWLISNGALAEFVGAMFMSDSVATTLSQDIVPGLQYEEPQVQKKMMFSVCFVSFSFIMSSSYMGMPVSGTHAVIGALLGAGWISTGFMELPW